MVPEVEVVPVVGVPPVFVVVVQCGTIAADMGLPRQNPQISQAVRARLQYLHLE